MTGNTFLGKRVLESKSLFRHIINIHKPINTLSFKNSEP